MATKSLLAVLAVCNDQRLPIAATARTRPFRLREDLWNGWCFAGRAETTRRRHSGNRSNRSALPWAIFARSAGETGSASRNARARAFDANG